MNEKCKKLDQRQEYVRKICVLINYNFFQKLGICVKIFEIIMISYGPFRSKIDGAPSKQMEHKFSAMAKSTIPKFSSTLDAKKETSSAPQKIFVLTQTGSLEVLNMFEQFYDSKKSLNVDFLDSIKKSHPILFVNTTSSQAILYHLGVFRFFDNVQKYFEKHQNSTATIRIDTQAFEFLLLAIKKQDEREKQKKPDASAADVLKDDPQTSYIGQKLGKALCATGQIVGKAIIDIAAEIPKKKVFDILWKLYEKWRWNNMNLLEKTKKFFMDSPEISTSIATKLIFLFL
ncbi:MAG: hypothetical protein LBH08_00180 [Puniceicoccales bacterium]|jgi:hypothetical protein|nr:hypothetical protein [Puniceicoccales bacterium]